VLRPETHELVERLTLLFLPLGRLLAGGRGSGGRGSGDCRYGRREGEGIGRLFKQFGVGFNARLRVIEIGLIWGRGVLRLCEGAIVIENSHLLWLDDALAEDIVEGVVVLHVLRPLCPPRAAGRTSPVLQGPRSRVFLHLPFAHLRERGTGLSIQAAFLE
jgi:hypothetical protein